MISIDEEIRIIAKGASELIDYADLRSKLEYSRRQGQPLVVKLGMDPSAPDIHLGHTVVLRKIKQLQDLGHQAVIIIGDFTGMIGDPTGKSKTRKQLSREAVLANARTYQTQIAKILDLTKTKITYNGDWLGPLDFAAVIKLASGCTVARMLEREDFKNRFALHQEIGVHEFFYPLMQAYDSVAIRADIELGGTDQRFNILMGRNLQQDYGQERQVALLMPLLVGTDGTEKMSKSLGNYIGIDETPNTIYGKAMSIPDELILSYFALATDIHPDTLASLRQDYANGTVQPRDLKMRLAKELVRLYHGETSAQAAEAHFIQVFQQKSLPAELPALPLSRAMLAEDRIELGQLLVAVGFAPSKNEAKRLIQQGAVKIDGVKVTTSGTLQVREGLVLQVGKLRFGKLTLE